MITQYRDLDILDVIWITQGKTPFTIGMVVVKNRITGEQKVYVGTALGVNEDMDIEDIINMGGKLSFTGASILFQQLNE